MYFGLFHYTVTFVTDWKYASHKDRGFPIEPLNLTFLELCGLELLALKGDFLLQERRGLLVQCVFVGIEGRTEDAFLTELMDKATFV